MEKRYKVVGRFEGKRISEVVSANSTKQAKLRAGFKAGIYGNKTTEFMKVKGTKVRKVK